MSHQYYIKQNTLLVLSIDLFWHDKKIIILRQPSSSWMYNKFRKYIKHIRTFDLEEFFKFKIPPEVEGTMLYKLLVLAAAAAYRPACAAVPLKKSVLFVMADDLRPELGCYGCAYMKT